jgi:predicted transcriptional regulator
MLIKAVISALAGGAIGFFLAGFGAVMLLVPIFGHRDGGTDMGGFFGFGPIGGIAGALLGAGLALRFGGGPLKWCQGLMVSAGIVAALGGMLLAFASSPDRGPSYAEVIEFQLEYPSSALAGVDIPSATAMWGAAGADSDDHPISQFFEKKCESEMCVLNGSIAALGPMNNFRIAVSIGQKKYRYPLDLPTMITGPVDWSEWRQGESGWVRWRIVKRWASTLTEPSVLSTLRRMEVHLLQQHEARLNDLSAQTGRGTDELVQEAVAQLLDYTEWFQAQVQIGVDQIARREFIEEADMDARVERMLRP